MKFQNWRNNCFVVLYHFMTIIHIVLYSINSKAANQVASGLSQAISGNIGLAATGNLDAPIYNPATLLGRSQKNFSVSTSMLNYENSTATNSSLAEINSAPSVSFNSGLIVRYFESENKSHGVFLANTINNEIQKEFLLSNSTYPVIYYQYQFQFQEQKLGYIIAQPITQIIDWGATFHLSAAKLNITSKNKSQSAGATTTQLSYQKSELSGYSLGTRLGLSVKINANQKMGFIAEINDFPFQQQAFSDTTVVSTDGTVKDTTKSFNDSYIPQNKFGIGYANQVNDKWIFLTDINYLQTQYKSSEDFFFNKNTATQSIGAATTYIENNKSKWNFGYTYSIAENKSNDFGLSHAIHHYLSMGQISQFKNIETTLGLYLASTVQTGLLNQSIGFIFGSSFEY